jgi:hypothetical protein
MSYIVTTKDRMNNSVTKTFENKQDAFDYMKKCGSATEKNPESKKGFLRTKYIDIRMEDDDSFQRGATARRIAAEKKERADMLKGEREGRPRTKRR